MCSEGGHGNQELCTAATLTGKEVERALVEATRKHPNVTFYENHACVDLMTSSSSSSSHANNNERRCVGAVAVSSCNENDDNDFSETSKIVRFYASTTLLACGGAGQLFPSTTNGRLYGRWHRDGSSSERRVRKSRVCAVPSYRVVCR